MRSQWCRSHIDEAAEKCGLEKSTVSDVKQAAKFCAERSEFSNCSTHSIMALIRVRDDLVRERAISLAQNALNATTPSGGKKKYRLTEREIKKLIGQAELELRKKLTEEYLEDKNALPSVVPEPDESSIGTEPGPKPEPSSSPAAKRHWCIKWIPIDRQREYIDQAVAAGDYFNRVEAVSAAVDLMMESTPLARATDLEIQNSGLGTQCSGETAVVSHAGCPSD